MTQLFRFLTLMFLVLALGACSNAKRSLGLERTPPDEFRVITRAPLTLPPNFNIKPPSQAGGATANAAPREEAQEALFGSSSAPATSEDGAFLNLVGAGKSNPNIRAIIDKETAQLVEANKTLLNNITNRKTDPTAVLVDPVKEKERLEKNKAEGLPPNSGTVPTIKPRRSGLF